MANIVVYMFLLACFVVFSLKSHTISLGSSV